MCGDGTCDPGEDHEGCPEDCPRCGDGRCERRLGEGFDACPEDCPGPPANDACEAAQELVAAGQQEASGTTELAAPAEGFHWSDSPAVFYRFELDQPASLVAVMEADPAWDTWLVLLAGTCEDAETVASNDDFSGRHVSRVAAAALEPGPHLLVATGYDEGDAGPFRLLLAFSAPARCGDGVCAEAQEDPEGCPGDCPPPPRCGDGECQPDERPDACPQDCACGDGLCEPGHGEDRETCLADCPPPANDTCDQAVPLVPGAEPVRIHGDTAQAASDLAVRCGWYVNEAPDVFYSFTLEERRLATVRVAAQGDWDGVVFLLADGCGPDARVVACNDDAEAGGSEVRAPLDPGSFSVLVTGRSPDAAGEFLLTLETAAPPPRCGDAVCEPPESWEDCPEDCDLWCGDHDCVAGEDAESCPEDCGPGVCGNHVCEPEAEEDWQSCWYDCEDPCGDGVCDGQLGEEHAVCPEDCPEAPPPDNDACEDAADLPAAGGAVEGTTAGAVRDLPDASCQGPDVFSELTLDAPASLVLVVEADWDSCLRLLTGPCGEPREVARDGGGQAGARLEVPALEAGSYLVAVSGLRASDAGPFTLTPTPGAPVVCGDLDCAAPAEDWRTCPADCEAPAAPGHDTCAGALALPPAGQATQEGSTATARRDCEVCWGEGPDVFYSVSPAEPAALELQVDPDPVWGATLHLLAGPCDDLVTVADGSRVDLERLEAGDYLVVVGGRAAADLGAFTLTATFGPAGNCGDGVCEGEEGWRSCPEDCARCGNGLCQRNLGEDEESCPEDCFSVDNDACERAVALAAEGEHTVEGVTRCGSPEEAAWCPVPDVFYGLSLEAEASLWATVETDWVWFPELVLLAGTCGELEPVAPEPARRGDFAFPALAPGPYVLVVTGRGVHGGGPFSLTTALSDPVACDDGVCSERFEDFRSCADDCAPPPPPDNDRCGDAEPIPAEGEQDPEGTTLFATSQYAPHAPGSADVFFRFTLEAEALVDLVLEAEGWDPWLYLLSGPCGALVEVASNDDDEDDLRRSRVVERALAAGDYVVVVAGRSPDESGDFTLGARFGDPVVCGDGVCTEGYEAFEGCPDDCEELPVPDNDLCAGAAALEDSGTVEGSTEHAGHDYAPNERGSPDVFYAIHLEQAASVELLLEAGEDWDVELVLLSGTCDLSEEVARNNLHGTHTVAYLHELGLDAGDYLVVVTGWDADARGPFTLTVTFGEAVVCGDEVCNEAHEDWERCPQDCAAPPAPDNDACADAVVVPAEGVQPLDGTTVSAGYDYLAGGRDSPDVFYAFTLDQAAAVDVLMVGDGGWDTYLFLLSGACGATQEVAHDDDWQDVGDSRVRVPELPPGDYRVVATGYDELASGDFSLELRFSAPVVCGDGACAQDWGERQRCPQDCGGGDGPPNDACAGAAVIPSHGEQERQGTTEDAAHDYEGHDEPSPDVFYRFTLGGPASVEIVLAEDGWWFPHLYLLGGTCEDYAQLDDDMWGDGISRGRLAPGDYLIVVTGFEPDDFGGFTLTVTFGPPE